MKHRVIAKLNEAHPYEVLKIELLGNTKEEESWILNMTEETENFLTMNLNVVEVLEQNPPYFVVKMVKRNIGFGS